MNKFISACFLALAIVFPAEPADEAAPLAAGPVTVDTLTAALGPEPAPPAPPISYLGAGLSAVIPGAGQVYHKNYIMGAGFFTAEAITGIVSLNRWESWTKRLDGSKQLRETGREYAAPRVEDSIMAAYRDSVAGLYSVLADRAEFEARQTKYTAYNAFAWTVGIHYYSFMDALERGGVTARGKAKDPAIAGLLAAAPFLGLGQLYNGHPGKAGMMSMTQAALAATAINHHRLMENASGKYNEMRDSTSAQFIYRDEHLAYWKARYNRSFSRRNTYMWISLFAYLYSIFDAVVDAHLSDYAERINFGSDLSVGADGGGVSFELTVGF